MAEFWVRHTIEVEEKLAQVLVSNLRMEVYRRGFVMNAQAHDLAALRLERVDLRQEMSELRQLVADNPEQRPTG